MAACAPAAGLQAAPGSPACVSRKPDKLLAARKLAVERRHGLRPKPGSSSFGPDAHRHARIKQRQRLRPQTPRGPAVEIPAAVIIQLIERAARAFIASASGGLRSVDRISDRIAALFAVCASSRRISTSNSRSRDRLIAHVGDRRTDNTLRSMSFM